MKLTDNAQAAMQNPDTKTATFEMTRERRRKYAEVSAKLYDLLTRETEGPLEAYAILQFTMHGFEDVFGIRGGIIMENDDSSS